MASICLSMAPVLLLCLMTVDFCHSTPYNEVNRGLLDLREHLDQRLESFRADLRLSFEREHQRIRRAADLEDIDLVGDIVGREPLLSDKVTALAQFFVDLQVYIIIGREVSVDGSSYQSSAEIRRFDGANYTTTDVFPTDGVSDIETFLVGGQIYIAVANQRGPVGYDGQTKIYRFDAATERAALMQQVLTLGVADVHFFEFEGDVYLAQAELRGDGYAKYRTELKIFVFSGAHFDLLASVQTYGATAVTVMQIEWEPYIIVAQYVDNEGRYDIGSVVYKFETHTDTLVKVQILATSAPKDVEAFSMYGNHYLAVANSGEVRADGSLDSTADSVIYWWTGLQFIEYQRIPTQDASQWEQLELPNGEILLLLSSQQGVTIYEFSAESEWEPAEAQVPGIPSGTGRATIEVVDTVADIFIVVADSLAVAENYTNGTTNVFQVVPSAASPYVRPADSIPVCIRMIESRLDGISSDVDDLHEKLLDTVTLEGDQDISSKVDFRGKVVVARSLTVENLTIVEDYSFHIDPAVIEDSIEIGDKLRPLLAEKDNVVTITGDENIPSPLLFKQPVVSTKATVVDTYADDGRINGIHILSLNDSVVWLRGDQIIDGLVTLTANVTLTDSNLLVQGDVNGISIPGDVMATSGAQTALGSLTFTDTTTFADDVTVDGLVGGLKMSTDVVTTHLDHVIYGQKTVGRDLVLAQAAVVDEGLTVDTVDLSLFESQLIPLASGGVVSGVVTFQGPVSIDGQLLTDLIDGVNLTDLNRVAVLVDTKQDILGKKFFEGTVTIQSDVTVVSAINNASVSTFVQLDVPGGAISTPLLFAQTVHMQGSLEVTGTLNQINMPREVVTIRGAQEISEVVNFTQSIAVHGDIEVLENAEVAGYDISEIPLRTVSTSSRRKQTIGGAKYFTKNVDVWANVSVAGFISGVNLTLLQQQVLSLTQPQVVDLWPEVRGRLVIRDALLLVNDTIDGYRLSQDLVGLADASTVTGYKIFKELASIGGDLALAPGIRISGVDLPELNRTVVKLNAVQTIGGKVAIRDDVTIRGNLDIDGLVNGLNISRDVVTLNGNQDIRGNIKFETALVLTDVYTSTLNVSQGVNGVNLDDLYSTAVMSDGQGVAISSAVTFDQLEVKKKLSVTGTVDGVDVEDFAANVVTLTGNQKLSGTFEFASDIDFSQNLTVRRNVSGIHFDSLISSVVLRDTPGPIYGEKTFTSNFSVNGDVTVNDVINDVDIEALNGIYLSRTIDQELRGVKYFSSTMSLDNLSLMGPSGSVEGVVPSTDLVLINTGGEEINGKLWFSSFLEVDGTLDIAQTINDVDLLQLYNSVVWLEGGEQNITGPWTLEGGIHVIGNISMEEHMTVNGVDISELADTLASSGQNQTVQIPAVFKGPVTIDGNVESRGLINGVDIGFIYTDAVRNGSSQTISGDKVFAGNATAQRLEVETNMMSMVAAGTANLKHLLDKTVLKSGNQVLRAPAVFKDDVVFQESVIVRGLVEGIDLSVQAVLTFKDQELTGTNVFENGFQVTGNLSTAGLIDGVDVSLLPQVVFLVDRYQVVQGLWGFHDNVTVIGDIDTQGDVNGIDIGLTLVTMTGPHEITGSKTFAGRVTIYGDLLAELVNSVNLVEFEAEIVHLVGDYTLTGDKAFSGRVVVLANATVTGLVDGIDIQEMYLDHQATPPWLYLQIARLNDTLRSMCQPIASLQLAVKAQAYQLSYWEEEYHLNNSLATYRYDSVEVEGGLLIALIENSEAAVDDCIGTTLYLCMEEEEDGCHEAYNESLSAASNTELFEFQGDIFIVLALSPQSAACTSITGTDDEVQVLRMSNATYDVRLPAGHAVDTAMFVIDGTLFLAVANQYDPTTGDIDFPSAVFEYDAGTGGFSQLQEVATTGSSAVAHLEHAGNNWLAFTCNPYSTYSLITRWNATAHQFVLEASILTDSASDVLGMVIDGSPLMIFANEKQLSRHGTVDLNQPIAIYQYTVTLGWMLKQEVSAVGIIGLDAFRIETISYLVAVSSRGAIDMYKWSGASQFEFYKSLPMDGVSSVHLFVHWDNLHMAIARPAFHSIITEESRAFTKAVIRGQTEDTDLEVV